MTDSNSSSLTTGDQKPSVAAILEKARSVISDPSCWTKGAYARDRYGNALPNEWASGACCWCASGALFRTELNTANWIAARRALIIAMDGGVAKFNDHHTHAEVLAAFDRAIELATNSETGSPVARDQSNGQSLSKES